VSDDILADLALALQTLFVTSSFGCSVCLCVVCVDCFALGHRSGARWTVLLICFLGCFHSVFVVIDNVSLFVNIVFLAFLYPLVLLMLGFLFLTFQQMLGNFMMVAFRASWALPGRP
jgi:hypothetical protein